MLTTTQAPFFEDSVGEWHWEWNGAKTRPFLLLFAGHTSLFFVSNNPDSTSYVIRQQSPQRGRQGLLWAFSFLLYVFYKITIIREESYKMDIPSFALKQSHKNGADREKFYSKNQI